MVTIEPPPLTVRRTGRQFAVEARPASRLKHRRSTPHPAFVEREESTMAGKTPQKAAAKKQGKTLKEKRAVKKEKKDHKGLM